MKISTTTYAGQDPASPCNTQEDIKGTSGSSCHHVSGAVSHLISQTEPAQAAHSLDHHVLPAARS
ncbi:hypothetical protein JZ751_011045 [Albula glossodonta]|uniref:Uncharacterized protein n=1 Tax=Albula glossodonta TaxID=121402 RepID=A0A8T2NXY2_9TELE|nr:hypothetical protein JZ751_011045 [Albula glossodonta]